MNGQNVPPDVFTEDDKMGLWAMLEAVRSGQRKCGDDTVKVDMEKNTWGSLICDPQAVPKVDHQSLPDRLMSDSLIASNSTTGPKPAALAPGAMGLTTESGKNELPIKEGLWALEGYNPDQYQLLIQKIPGEPMAFRTIAFINGQSASSKGIIYRCASRQDSNGVSHCLPSPSTKLRFEVLAVKRGVIVTPKIRQEIGLVDFLKQ